MQKLTNGWLLVPWKGCRRQPQSWSLELAKKAPHNFSRAPFCGKWGQLQRVLWQRPSWHFSYFWSGCSPSSRQWDDFPKKEKSNNKCLGFLNWCYNAYREREAQHFEGWLLLSVRKSPNNAHNPANEAGKISLAKFTMLKGITVILSVWLINHSFRLSSLLWTVASTNKYVFSWKHFFWGTVPFFF